jgi:hypothetical protein
MALEKRHPDSIKVENEAAYLAVLAGDQESEKNILIKPVARSTPSAGIQQTPICIMPRRFTAAARKNKRSND